VAVTLLVKGLGDHYLVQLVLVVPSSVPNAGHVTVTNSLLSNSSDAYCEY